MRSARLIIILGTLVFFNGVTLSRQQTGYAVKKPVFGGSGPVAGWGSIGVIAKEAMKFYGWDIQICASCAGGARASRLVAAAAVPPPAGPSDPPAPKGPLDFGATGSQYLWWAYQASHDFAKDPEGPRKQLRLIANIQSPSYIVVAVKANSGITDLRQIKEKCLPVRILTFARRILSAAPNSIPIMNLRLLGTARAEFRLIHTFAADRVLKYVAFNRLARLR
jgi:hypothetical protein